MDRYSVESIKTLNLGNELSKFGLMHKEMEAEQKEEEFVKEEDIVKEEEPEQIPMFRVFDIESSGEFKKEMSFEFRKESS